MSSVFVLVGGWPASGKSTLSVALSKELEVPYLSKDEVKESLMDVLGPPRTVEESRQLGVAAVHAVLRMARNCPGAVIDSTWFEYMRPLVDRLPGLRMEIRCVTNRDTVRARYAARIRDARHLDGLREESELWGQPVAPLRVGPLIEVDTTHPADAAALAKQIRSMTTTDSNEERLE